MSILSEVTFRKRIDLVLQERTGTTVYWQGAEELTNDYLVQLLGTEPSAAVDLLLRRGWHCIQTVTHLPTDPEKEEGRP